MMLRTLNITLGVMVALSVWCAALLIGVLALRVLVGGGLAVYNLMHS
jgi:hypothetical protein